MKVIEQFIGKMFNVDLRINSLVYPFIIGYAILVYCIYPLDQLIHISSKDIFVLVGVLLFGGVVSASLMDVKERE